MELNFHYPGRGFPSISVTGDRCELQCDHCQGHYLKGMHPALDPADLRTLATTFVERGMKGFILSGGCDRRGRVPFEGYLDVVSDIKRETDLKINVHCGLVDEGVAKALSPVDMVSLDVHQDERVIKGALNLNAGREEYGRTLAHLLDAGLSVVPHIIVGLSEENEKGSVDLIADQEVKGLVVLVLIKKGVVVARDRVLRTVDRAISAGVPTALGCMRPRRDRELEKELILRGVRTIAVPSRRTVEWASRNGYGINERDDCCCLGIDGSL